MSNNVALVARRRLCGARCRATSGNMMRTAARQAIGKLAHWMLDFALPPRCAGCGAIVDDVHSFCTDCWKWIEFLGSAGCVTCGLPLQATDAEHCAVCLARPPRIARTRAAVAYDEVSRGLALRLKYGRKVAIAKTMARYMAPLIGTEPPARCWCRCRCIAAACGSAASTSRRSSPANCRDATGLEATSALLKRVKRTPPLKGMSLQQRRRVGRRRVQGRRIGRRSTAGRSFWSTMC